MKVIDDFRYIQCGVISVKKVGIPQVYDVIDRSYQVLSQLDDDFGGLF